MTKGQKQAHQRVKGPKTSSSERLGIPLTKIYVNDYIEIYFDNYGIAKKVDFYDLESMQQITFNKENTKTIGVKDSFSKNLLSSTRKRLENARKKFD